VASPGAADTDTKPFGTLSGHAVRLLGSPALAAAAMLTAGGIGFAVANILLARVMVRSQFGELSLFLALTQLALSVGPLGLEITINRHRLDAGPALLARALVSSGAVGAALAAGAALFYGLDPALSVCLALAAAGAAVNRVAAAFLQSHGRFGHSLLLMQIHNYILVCGVPLLLVLGRGDALPVAALIATAYSITASIGWAAGWRLPKRALPVLPKRLLLKEGLAAVGIGFAVQVLWQLERLVIPRTLSVDDLATFAVLASIAASPFRMMQTGIGFTLLPGLRNAGDKAEVKRLLYRETTAVCVVAAGALAAVFLLTPWVANHVLANRYSFSVSLLVAVVVVGLVKLWNGFAGAIVPALGTARELAALNAASWVAVVVGAAAALWGSRFGLTGLVYGVGFSWLGLAAVGTALSVRAVGRLRR
jgi:O-antigen/teichoic acid export membrane protein